MSMYDDLDPVFIPSPDTALAGVAARVHRMRVRRRLAFTGVTAAVVVVVVLVSVALGSSGSNPHRLTVANTDTTTTRGSKPIASAPKATLPPTSTSKPKSTTSTAAPTTVPVTAPVITVPRKQPVPPAHLTVRFDRDRLVIQSGTTVTVSYKVTNSGAGPGRYAQPACPDPQLWPDHVSQTTPVLWAVPAKPVAFCSVIQSVTIGAHSSKTFHIKLLGGLLDGVGNNIVPAPAGNTTFTVTGARLPVTITAPAQAPITVVHPSAVTTVSNTTKSVPFTITNNLPFIVRYVDQGPCSQEIGIPCEATTKDGSITGDMRLPPYNTAKKPLYLTHYLLGANETTTGQAQVNGTTTLEDIGLGSPAMPPGTYYFDWDGQKVTFTVTPGP